MSDIAIQQVLSQMRTMAAAARGEAAATQSDAVSFASALRQSVAEVNESMLTSRRLADAFDQGDDSVSLPDLMVSAQKASLEFQALTEVRNKLLSAYQEVMNMPV
jgi:flagellar hook-basal body complex protein FliE